MTWGCVFVSCSHGENYLNLKRPRVVFMGDSVIFGGLVDDKRLATNLFALARPDLKFLMSVLVAGVQVIV